MRKIPYGYILDPNDNRQILPTTNVSLIRAQGDIVYKDENIIEDGYYLTKDNHIAFLPPGMMPDISGVTYEADSNGITVLKYKYNTGYISKERFYLKAFDVGEKMAGLPPGFYYTDASKKKISFLPDGKIVNTEQGWGYKNSGVATDSIDPANKLLRYSDISRNFIDYHPPTEVIQSEMENKGLTRNLGGYMSIVVKDKDGNLIQMPVPDTSYGLLGIDSEIYYKAGQYPYGAQTYVPSYEDYIYLTRSNAHNAVKTSMAKYVDDLSAKGGFCEATKHSEIQREIKCNELDGNVCAATQCCVLLGGEKCVSGNSEGPKDKTHYGDLFVKNKDYYYYNSKCYGNCPV